MYWKNNRRINQLMKNNIIAAKLHNKQLKCSFQVFTVTLSYVSSTHSVFTKLFLKATTPHLNNTFFLELGFCIGKHLKHILRETSPVVKPGRRLGGSTQAWWTTGLAIHWCTSCPSDTQLWTTSAVFFVAKLKL